MRCNGEMDIDKLTSNATILGDPEKFWYRKPLNPKLITSLKSLMCIFSTEEIWDNL